MKAILEFDLTDEDDRAKYLRAVLADNAYSCLWDVNQTIRKKIKDFKNSEVDDFILEVLYELQKDILASMDANQINLDEQYS